MLHSLRRIFATALLLFALPALAQSDPPARVGRLSLVEGEVSLRTDRNDPGGPATLNWPVSSGAVLETGRRGRSEVWVGSTAYRLDGDSQVEFPVIDDHRVDVRLSGGTLAVSVLDRDQVDDVEVVTPDGTIRFQTPGRYRIDVYGDRSELSVLAGRATFDNGQRTMPVAAGQKGVLSSEGGEQLGAARGYDAFDQWVANRENASLAGPARRHVSPHMTGYQDLDAYGDWQNAPDYGAVWYPRAVATDWAPYRHGRWAWVAPWGWTWIDQAPWGFAPFHYGRWALIHGRWGWVPGRLVARPVYAPALVGWVGNPGWSVSFSFGSAPAVGWFPLAPREVYVPAYRYSPNYVRQINVTHVSNVTHIDRAVRGEPGHFVHRAAPRALTVVPSNYLREGRAISNNEMRHADRRDIERAPLALQAPSAGWVAPAPSASRPHGGERVDVGRGPRRESDAGRPNFAERDAGRTVPMPNRQGAPDMNGGRGDTRRVPEMGRDSVPDAGREVVRDGRRDMPRPAGDAVDERGRSRGLPGRDMPGASSPGRLPEATLPAPRQESPVPEMRRAVPEREPMREPMREERRDVRPDRQLPGGVMESGRPQRREMPGVENRPMPSDSGFRRSMEARPEIDSRRSAPDLAPPRREAPVPELRREERPQPVFQPPEREQRREMREVQREAPRFERPVQPPTPVMTPQAMPQREMPRPAPEVRMPAPQPVAPQAAPQPRAEPPRQQPAQQGSGNEPHRRRDEERGPRN